MDGGWGDGGMGVGVSCVHTGAVQVDLLPRRQQDINGVQQGADYGRRGVGGGVARVLGFYVGREVG